MCFYCVSLDMNLIGNAMCGSLFHNCLVALTMVQRIRVFLNFFAMIALIMLSSLAPVVGCCTADMVTL